MNNMVHQIRAFNIFSSFFFFYVCILLPFAALLFGFHLLPTPLYGVTEVLVYFSHPCFAFLSQKSILIQPDSILYLSVTREIYTKRYRRKEGQQSVCSCTCLPLNVFFFFSFFTYFSMSNKIQYQQSRLSNTSQYWESFQFLRTSSNINHLR